MRFVSVEDLDPAVSFNHWTVSALCRRVLASSSNTLLSISSRWKILQPSTTYLSEIPLATWYSSCMEEMDWIQPTWKAKTNRWIITACSVTSRSVFLKECRLQELLLSFFHTENLFENLKILTFISRAQEPIRWSQSFLESTLSRVDL